MRDWSAILSHGEQQLLAFARLVVPGRSWRSSIGQPPTWGPMRSRRSIGPSPALDRLPEHRRGARPPAVSRRHAGASRRRRLGPGGRGEGVGGLSDSGRGSSIHDGRSTTAEFPRASASGIEHPPAGPGRPLNDKPRRRGRRRRRGPGRGPGRRGGAREPKRKKRQPRASIGTTASIAAVRFVGPGRRGRTARVADRQRRGRAATRPRRPAEQVGDFADQERRADVAEQVDQEDAHRVARGPAVGRHDVGRHRVARAEHRAISTIATNSRPATCRRSGSSMREHARDGDRHGDRARPEQVGAAGEPRAGSRPRPGPQRDPDQAGDGRSGRRSRCRPSLAGPSRGPSGRRSSPRPRRPRSRT